MLPLRAAREKSQSLPITVNTVDDILSSKLSNDFQINQLVQAATKEIISQQGAFNVTTFCQDYGSHKSTLQKNFVIHTGLKPKQFPNIIRFNYTHLYITRKKFSSLTEAACACGYFDQSHMIKEFRKITNATPRDMLSNRRVLPQLTSTFYTSINEYFFNNDQGD